MREWAARNRALLTGTAKAESGRFVKFAIVGLTNMIVDVGLFSFFFYGVGLHLILANTLGFTIAATSNFAMNKYWTFSATRHHGRIHHQFVQFLLMGVVGLGISNLVVWAFSSFMVEWLAKLASGGVVILWSFTISRLVVFRARHGT